MPVSRQPRPAPEPELLFCAICQVSVTASELSRGTARRTPRGRIFCPICTRSTREEREKRRRALEVEFADDAPIDAPPPATRRRTGSAPVAPPRPRAVAAAPTSGVRPPAGPTLEHRVAELERAAFRLRTRLDSIEETLAEILRRLA